MKTTVFLRLGAAALIVTAASWGAKEESRSADVRERLNAADVAFREIMKVQEKSIPQDLLERAHCAVIIPGLKKGAFLVGAKYGKGFITCRNANNRGWSAPGAVRLEGGSFGLQIGGGETDAVMLVMNESGANRLLKSEFKLGGEASAMAGPVGRTVQADTDLYMRAEILGWSRSRGAFAGLSLEGSTLREDKEDNQALYGRALTNEEIVKNRVVPVPAAARTLMKDLGAYSFREKK